MGILRSWKDEAFAEILKTEISPRKSLQKPDFPNGCITVAVHMRMGGGFQGDILLQNAEK